MNPQLTTDTARYAESRSALCKIVNKLNADIEELKRQAMPTIKRLVAATAEREAVLRNCINENRNDFSNPRTVVINGIRIGFRKGSGGISWDDDAQVVKRIRGLFEDEQAELLIKTTETPIRKAITELDAATLKRLGCRVEDTGDVVVIKPADSDVDKIVNALLKGATEE
jgi:hypothetical protein